ncbi:hypothetical protein KY343_05820 [Candidatus Woesearchaeota archaeon]|nr:hypothetical protein [Candidatus Woesearchaeota archaeon]
MKNKILIGIFAFIFVILSTVVYADIPVDYTLREATVLDSGDISYTTNPVTNVNVIGYACADENCNDITGAALWDLNSGSSDVIQITYPTDLPASGYYAVFFYKEGYIPYEIRSWWHGTAGVQSSTAYLSKKDVGRAPIDSFNVLNEVQPNIPLVMEIDAALDGATYAALHEAGPVGYTPSELIQHYSVETRITLKVYDEDESVVYEEEGTIDIPYSGSAKVNFIWTPEESGDYRAVVSTFVTDAKFLTSEEQEASSEFHVIEEDPKDMCYTLLNDLKISNQFPHSDETITISGSKISNYADDNYILTAIPTELVLQVLDDSGAVVYSETSSEDANDNVVDKESFEFEWTPDQEGWYDILVTGAGSSNLCTGLSNLDETERIKVYVSGAAPASAPVLEGIPDYDLEEGEAIGLVEEDEDLRSIPLIDLWSFTTDADTADEDLRFSIVSQSNEDLTLCSIDSNRYIGCSTTNGHGYSEVTVEVSDGENSDRDSFRITVNKVTESPIIGNVPNIELKKGGSVSLDLDDYVTDDDPVSEISWRVSGAEHVEVSIDPISHVAIFSAKDDEWDGQEELVFTATDSDGLTDSDICVATVLNKLEEGAERNELAISRVMMNDIINSEDILQLNIKFDNRGNQDLEDIRISATILDLDVYDSEGPFDLDEDEQTIKNLFLIMPEYAEPGYYYVRISVSNNKVRRVIYREFIIE